MNIDIQTRLHSTETPKFGGKLENVTVNEGQEAKFTIKIAGGKPKPTVKWFKEEEEIVVTTVETYEIVEVEDTVTLIIKSAKPDNSGNYYAQLVNEAGQISSNKALLTVNSTCFSSRLIYQNFASIVQHYSNRVFFYQFTGGPVFVKVPEPLAPINKEESVRLECVVEGNPKPTVSW